jgi:hypothetical protein
MSLKAVKRPERFPMQDEHERRKNGIGVARPGASADVECREPQPGADSGVSQIERTDRICRVWAEREVRLGGARAGAQNYGELGKQERGVVRAYVEKVTGMSAARTTRLIRAFLDKGVVQAAPYQRHSFSAVYTPEDIGLLADVDRAHARLSGSATRRILQREYEQ